MWTWTRGSHNIAYSAECYKACLLDLPTSLREAEQICIEHTKGTGHTTHASFNQDIDIIAALQTGTPE